MDKITLFRIEHDTDGVGPFQPSDYYGTLQEEIYYKSTTFDQVYQSHSPSVFPNPRNDNGIGFDLFTQYHYCAYKSLEDLLRMNDIITLIGLIDYSFSIYRLEVEEAIIGEHQAIFKKEHIISREDISNLI